jgi:diguanylate cyclase (GGDEF)-like protein/PAS domain S-box-containing protein
VGLFALILAASLLFQVFYVIPYIRNEAVKATKTHQEEIARSIVWELDHDLQSSKTRLTMIAKQPELRTMDIANQHDYLVKNVETSTLGASLFVMDAEGWFVSSSVSKDNFSAYTTKSYADRPYFTVPFEQGQTYFGGSLFYPQLGLVGSSVSVPIELETGEKVGVLLGGMRLSNLMKRVADYPLGEGQVAYIVDEEGTVIAHSAIDLFALEEGPLSLDYSDHPLVRSTMDEGIGKSQEHEHEGVSYFCTSAIVNANDWGIVVRTPMHIILAESNALGRWLLWANFVLFVIALAVTVIFTRQITAEREKAMEKVSDSQQHLQLALDGGNLGTWDWDIRTDRVVFNERWAKMKGYKPEEIEPCLGSWENLVHPDDLPRVNDILKAYLEGKTDFYEAEFRMQQKSGKWLWILDRGKIIEWDTDGNPVRACGTHLDITERKQAEEALRESEKKYRLLAENVTDVIFVQDMNFNMTYVSPSVTPLSGYSVEEALNHKMKDFFTPDSYAKAMGSFQKAAALAKTKKDIEIPPMEYEYIRKDGSTLWGEIKVTFLRDSEGRAVGVQGVLRDITERKRAEEFLQQTTDRIERLHEIAHDLEACEDEDQVYRLTVEAAERTLSFSVCTLDIVEQDRLVVKATSSASPPEASQGRELKEGGLAAQTYRTKQTTVFGRIEDVPEATPLREDIRSGISAPIGDIGVFQAISTEHDAFTKNDARMIDLLLGHTYEAIRRIRLQQDLKHQAIHDPLTGVYNRRYFNERIGEEVERSRRYHHPISFLMLDIDRFKEINDTFGHQMGDKVLQEVAGLVSDQLRENDLVIRYGGDEFLIVLPETNSELQMITKRIQQAVAKRNKENPLLDFPVTLSIGAAHWEPKDDTPIEAVLAKADERMYEEKRQKSSE